MFGLGVWEIALICVAVLVFVRPEELPRVMRKLGTLYGRVTGSSRRIMRQLQYPPEFDDDPQQSDPGHSIAADGARARHDANSSGHDTSGSGDTGTGEETRKEA
jgi:Sec-independent protein translocase protein TatA